MAVAFAVMFSKTRSVPFMIFKDQRGGSLMRKFETVTSDTFQKTNGIGRPGLK